MFSDPDIHLRVNKLWQMLGTDPAPLLTRLLASNMLRRYTRPSDSGGRRRMSLSQIQEGKLQIQQFLPRIIPTRTGHHLFRAAWRDSLCEPAPLKGQTPVTAFAQFRLISSPNGHRPAGVISAPAVCVASAERRRKPSCTQTRRIHCHCCATTVTGYSLHVPWVMAKFARQTDPAASKTRS